MAKRIYYDTYVRAVQQKALPLMSDWADKNRIISKAAEKGPWRTSRFPFHKEIMNSLSPQDPVKEVIVVKPTQWDSLR